MQFQNICRTHHRGKEKFRIVNVQCSQCGRGIETVEETFDGAESGSDKEYFEVK